MIQKIRNKIEAWANSGPLWQQMFKTAATHAIVWGGATLLGTLAGLALRALLGLHPLWAFSVTLAGFGAGARFYLDRESGDVAAFLASPEHGSLAKLALKLIDSGLDLLVPLAVSTAIVVASIFVFAL